MNKTSQIWSQHVNIGGDNSCFINSDHLPKLSRRESCEPVLHRGPDIEISLHPDLDTVILRTVPESARMRPSTASRGDGLQVCIFWGTSANITGAYVGSTGSFYLILSSSACSEKTDSGCANEGEVETDVLSSEIYDAVQISNAQEVATRSNAAYIFKHASDSEANNENQALFSQHLYGKVHNHCTSHSAFSVTDCLRFRPSVHDLWGSEFASENRQLLNAVWHELTLYSCKSMEVIIRNRSNLIAHNLIDILGLYIVKCISISTESVGSKSLGDTVLNLPLNLTLCNVTAYNEGMIETRKTVCKDIDVFCVECPQRASCFGQDTDCLFTKRLKNDNSLGIFQMPVHRGRKSSASIVSPWWESHWQTPNSLHINNSYLQNQASLRVHIRKKEISFEHKKLFVRCKSYCDFDLYKSGQKRNFATPCDDFMKDQTEREQSLEVDQCTLKSELKIKQNLSEQSINSANYSSEKCPKRTQDESENKCECSMVALGSAMPNNSFLEEKSQIPHSSLSSEHQTHLHSPIIPSVTTCPSFKSKQGTSSDCFSSLGSTKQSCLWSRSAHREPPTQTSQGKLEEVLPDHPWREELISAHSVLPTPNKRETRSKYDPTSKNVHNLEPDVILPAEGHNSLQRNSHLNPVKLFSLFRTCLFSASIPKISWCSKSFTCGRTQGSVRYKQKSFCLPLLLLCISFMFGLTTVEAQIITGNLALCTNEGQAVNVSGITDDPCINCYCKNGRVQCDKDQCPKLEGCHYILHEQMVCKGCKFKDKERKSGSSWNYKRNPCKQLSCRAGVVTISDVQCFTPCYRTLPPAPGTCCPRCEGCFFGGKSYSDGDSFQLPTDSCTTCKCQTGILVCERRQCPVLNCPPETIYQPDNECCPKCRDMRELFEAPDKLCYFAKQLYKQRKRFTPTKCAKCACKSFSNSSVSVCKTKTCPALNCPEEERAPLAGSQCCQVCVAKRTCQFGGETYKNREFWRPNICMTCSCEDGKTYCNRHKCNNSLWCPPGYRLQLSREQCCPTCVEHDAVCSVFGDPHYRTFDGLTYSFQGTCKYILAQPCKGKLLAGDTTKPRGRPRAYSLRKKSKMRNLALRRDDENYFMIKVRNGVRFSSGFAWTQMLVVLLAEHRISMLQGGVVKVNRHRIRRMPHTVPGQFTLTRAGGLVKLRTTIGLQVSWDGDSFVEVTVTTRLKFKVCGLCGSYNGVKADDLRGPDGRMYATGQEMGHAWRTGGTRACQSRPQLVASEPLCEQDAQARLRAHRVCSVFFGRAFSRCRKVVEVDVYVSSCVTDMCDCPSGRYCACEAIRAYISQCDRAGLQVKWDSLSDFCHISQECSPDSRLVECAETCPGTCDRTGSDVPCPLSCIEACWCRDRAKVFHDGHCIKPSDCPAKGR